MVHAHNLNPTLGWRALAAAREAGARVVLHLHQYRLVCAIGVCFTRGAECTRCHGRNTLPGVRLNCRGSLGEAAAYGASLALWQRRLAEQADAVIVPSVFARERLRELGAPLDWERVHVLAPPVDEVAAASRAATGSYALVVSRLAPEKGVDVAIDACRAAGMALVIAGDGPERDALEARAARRGGALRRPCGRRRAGGVARRRGDCAGALALGRDLRAGGGRGDGGGPAGGREQGWARWRSWWMSTSLVPAGDAGALAEAIRRVAGDRDAGARGLERVRALCAPEAVAGRLASIYEAAAG